jgi:hypothetical protein
MGMLLYGSGLRLLECLRLRVNPRDQRPALRELEWIQYQLDNCGSVAAVLELDANRLNFPSSCLSASSVSCVCLRWRASRQQAGE